MNNEIENHYFLELLIKSFEGQISPDEIGVLNRFIKSDDEAAYLYAEFFDTVSGLVDMDKKVFFPEDHDSTKYDVWLNYLADEEKTAPIVEIPAVLPSPKEDEISTEIHKVRPKVDKFSIFSLLLSSAALIFVIGYAHVVSLRRGIEVATLTDSMNAKWANTNTSIFKGTRFATGRDKLILREGLADLRFDNEAVVTLEGPAEFQILTEDQINLYYGRIYAVVPQSAIGFTVHTPSARIIDLGTKFGIEATAGGDTYLHVIDGKTTLIAGAKSKKVSMEVGKRMAKKISGVSSVVSDIPCNEKLFVRAFNADHKIVWRGDNLSLTSIFAGLDGFQEVGSLIGLDPVKGQYVTSVMGRWRKTNHVYKLTPDLKFIDGVFVPDGELGAIQITSLGHTFDCPDTSGEFTHEIAAYKGSIENQNTTILPVIIEGEEVVNEPVLMLHSNAGITFDLQAIRESLPQLDLKSLKATGVSTQKLNPNLDFWILVDGQIKYERKIVAADSDRGPIAFDIEFSPEDRFLTLIVADGLPNSYPQSYTNDFFYLIKPELCLTDSLER